MQNPITQNVDMEKQSWRTYATLILRLNIKLQIHIVIFGIKKYTFFKKIDTWINGTVEF